MTKVKNRVLVSMIILMIGILAACGETGAPEETNAKASGEKTEPVTIENMGRTIVFEEAPQRAVSLNQHATEIMLALGLEDSMVGTAYLDDDILPALKEAYEKVPVLSEQYPSQEVFLGAEPDFVYAGWKSAFADQALGSVEELEQLGIQAYTQASSNTNAPTMDDVFADIQNIGRIFRVEEKAEALTREMQEKMDAIHSKVKDVEEPVRVFVYDSGEKEPFTAGQNFLNEMITLAGGENIFREIEKGWASASWEEVVKRDPEVIVIIDYGDTTLEQKRNFLLNHPALRGVTAIKEERFIVLPLSAAAEGVRGPIAIEELAKGFYPERFE